MVIARPSGQRDPSLGAIFDASSEPRSVVVRVAVARRGGEHTLWGRPSRAGAGFAATATVQVSVGAQVAAVAADRICTGQAR